MEDEDMGMSEITAELSFTPRPYLPTPFAQRCLVAAADRRIVDDALSRVWDDKKIVHERLTAVVR